MPLRAKITATTDEMASLDSSSLQGQLEKAALEGKVPQAVVFAASRDGTWFIFIYLFSNLLGRMSVLWRQYGSSIDWSYALADLFSNGSQALSRSAMLLARLRSRRVPRTSKTTLFSCSLRRRSC